jgi:hypothetical protein
MKDGKTHSGAVLVAAGCLGLLLTFGSVSLAQQVQIPATLDDFFEPGTQELSLNQPLIPPQYCWACHQFKEDGNPDEVVAPYDNWNTSMMAQSARDPVWHAALAIANQDVNMSGDTCIRCHSPNAWLSGRSVPTDASAFTLEDFEGVTCNFCHRMVDPVANKNNPPEDDPILAALAKNGLLPNLPGNGRYVVDPDDTRRGPIADVPENFHGVPIIVSPFHESANLCGTCHDVSNAMYTRNTLGVYELNTLGEAHPTLNPHDMMPEQRTYSEWLNSAFANGGVPFPDQRFGGDHPTGIMQSCQDCHMPKNFGGLCIFWDSDPFFPRPDVAEHSFVGANTWVVGAVYDMYGSAESGLTPESVDLAQMRVENMLQNASDMQALQLGDQLKVRVINFSGHKLPTGYPEGRRMWLNIKYFNSIGDVIAEHGGYDFKTAELNTSNTKVYEMKLGVDAATAKVTGLPEGHTFHLTLNNVILKDNRIPPIGFTNEAFKAVRAEPVAHTYSDNQYWDDTAYAIPKGAVHAVATLYYQTTSKEYIEFLRDANTSSDPNHAGQIAYDQWVSRGMSAPVNMDVISIDLGEPQLGDVTHNGIVDVDDLLTIINGWGACPPPNLCASDVTGNGVTDVDDLLVIINNWG